MAKWGRRRCRAVSRKAPVCCGTVPIGQSGHSPMCQVSVFARLHPVFSPSLCRSHSPLSLVQGISYMHFSNGLPVLVHACYTVNRWQMKDLLYMRRDCRHGAHPYSVLYKVGETCSYIALHATELSGNLSVSAIAFSFCCEQCGTVRPKSNPLFSQMVRIVSLCHSSGYLSGTFQQGVRYRSFVT